jgi:hypothetical protein
VKQKLVGERSVEAMDKSASYDAVESESECPKAQAQAQRIHVRSLRSIHIRKSARVNPKFIAIPHPSGSKCLYFLKSRECTLRGRDWELDLPYHAITCALLVRPRASKVEGFLGHPVGMTVRRSVGISSVEVEGRASPLLGRDRDRDASRGTEETRSGALPCRTSI